MASGIQQNGEPVALWLVLGYPRAQRDGVVDDTEEARPRIPVTPEHLDGDVDVHHHPLLTVGGRPDGRHVVVRPLELHLQGAVGRGDQRPRPAITRVLVRDRPPEQCGVEPGQLDGVSRVEHWASEARAGQVSRLGPCV